MHALLPHGELAARTSGRNRRQNDRTTNTGGEVYHKNIEPLVLADRRADFLGGLRTQQGATQCMLWAQYIQVPRL